MKSIHLVGLGVVIALVPVTACKKSTVEANATASSASAAIVAATAQDDADAAPVEITPPAALVAADPNIPLNEAVVGTTPLPKDYTADTAPPAALVEQQPASPEPDDTWVSGYWWWSRPLARYVWISGAWRHPPPNQVWVAGSWNPSGGRYSWAPGYWGPRGQAREMIDDGPPPLQVEVRPPTPGAEFVWTPGYYRHEGGRYAWTGGTWTRPPSVGVNWVEPRYVSSGGRYYMQPGRWDYPPEHRGVVYHPDINVRPGARVTFTPVPPAVVAVHTNFVAESSRAVARGAERTPTGGYIVPRARVDEHVTIHENVNVQEHGGRVEEHVNVQEHINVQEHVGDPHARVEEHVNVQEHVNVPEPHANVRVEEHVNVHENVHVATPQANVHEHVAVQAPHATVEAHVAVHPTATTTARPPQTHERGR